MQTSALLTAEDIRLAASCGLTPEQAAREIARANERFDEYRRPRPVASIPEHTEEPAHTP